MEPAVINPILQALPAPAALGLAVTLIAWWSRRADRDPPPCTGRLVAQGPIGAGAIALGGGLLVGAVTVALIRGEAAGLWRPPAFSTWPMWIAAGAIVFALAERFWEGVRGLTWIFRAMAAVGLAMALSARVSGEWSAGERALWWAGFPALMLGSWWGLHRATIRPGPAGPVCLWLIASMLAAARVALGSIKGAEACAWVACACGGVIVASLVRPRAGVLLAGPGATVFALFVLGQLFIGVQNSDMALWHVALLAACPLVGVLADVGPLARLRPWPHAAVRAALTAIPALVVLAVVLPQAAKDAGG